MCTCRPGEDTGSAAWVLMMPWALQLLRLFIQIWVLRGQTLSEIWPCVIVLRMFFQMPGLEEEAGQGSASDL